MQTHLIRLSARNVLRHRARTLLTAGMVAMGVALLIVSVSWIAGIFGHMLAQATAMAGHVRIVSKEYAAREQLAPLYENIHPVEPLVAMLMAQPGVRAVYPRIATGVTVAVGEEIGEVFAQVLGAPAAYFKDDLKVVAYVEQGRWFEGDGELVMGYHVARQAGVEVGDDVVLLGMTQDGSLSPVRGTLVGILRGGTSFFDRQVFLSLDQAQWLVDIPDGAIEILVFGDRYQDAADLAGSLRMLPELGDLSVKAWRERDPWAGMMEMVQGIQGVVVFFVVLLAALGILNTMMVSVLERTGEVGVLRAMGLGRGGVVGIFLLEALVISCAGGGVGVLLGIAPAWILETRGIELGETVATSLSSDIPFTATVYADLSAEIVASAFLLGLMAAVVGSAIPAIRAAGIKPVVAMKNRR